MHTEEKYIGVGDFNLFTIVDTSDDAVRIIDKFYAEFLIKPNF